MRILLLSPPLGSLTHPSLSVPSLTGYLRSLGHEVLQHDVGATAIDILLSKERLSSLYAKAVRGVKNTSPGSFISGTKGKRKEKLARIELFAEDVIEKIEWAKGVLRSKEHFFQPQEYAHSVQIILRAFEIISAAFYPTELNNRVLTCRRPLTFRTISTLTASEACNPFLAVMRNDVLPELVKKAPDIVGISVTFTSQLIGAYTLARLVKNASPKAKVTLGGEAIMEAEETIRGEKCAHQWVDAYVFGEGEVPLSQFIELHEMGQSRKMLSPRLYLAIANEAKQPYPGAKGGQTSPEMVEDTVDFNTIPSPDYAGLNLRDYLAPEIIFLVSNHRGCYYRKCEFCACSIAFMKGFRNRSFFRVVADIRELQKKQDARYFIFSDDAVTPKRCGEIAAWSKNSQTPFYWGAEVRYEKEFTAKALREMFDGGCRHLLFGNESGSQRVLDLMNKKTDLQENLRIIRDASRAGIALNLQNFIGFPGETRNEARDTLNMLLSNREHISSYSLNSFSLQKHSPIFRKAASFGIYDIRLKKPDSLVPHYDFSLNEGINGEELQSLLKASADQLVRCYTCIDVFLDTNLGSHALMYFQHFNERKNENIFLSGFNAQAITTSPLKLKDTVHIRQTSPQKIVLYASHNGKALILEKDLIYLLPFLRKKVMLNEALAQFKERISNGSAKKRGEKISAAMAAVRGLHLKGFLDV